VEPARYGEVVECDDRRQDALKATFDHPPIVSELSLRDVARSRFDPRPLNTEPVGVEPEIMNNIQVLAPSVIAVTGVAAVFGEERSRRLLESPGVTVDVVAFDLVGG